MDVSAIASMSTAMHMAQTQEAVSVALMKEVMNSQEAQVASLVNDLQAANPAPSFGHQLDVLV